MSENKFGILNEAPWIQSFGQDSSDEKREFGIKAFIDIYNCVINQEKSKFSYKFWKKAQEIIPYTGELLDNEFFLNILFFILNEEEDGFTQRKQNRT